jgi:hypothetical protein
MNGTRFDTSENVFLPPGSEEQKTRNASFFLAFHSMKNHRALRLYEESGK